jgi:chitin deacetylase
MVLKSAHRVRYEIEKTDTLIINAWFTGTIHFRTPYGKRLFVTPWVLRSLGKANIFFDVEPETYVGDDASRIKEYVLQHTTSWSIILLHPMYGWNENKALLVLEDVIIWLKSKWFQFVTIDELLQQTNTQPVFW